MLPPAAGSPQEFDAGSLLGRWSSPVEDMQTPYVRPQENGARPDVRWAQLRDRAVGGAGIRFRGAPGTFWFTARRWTSEQLDAAAHSTDLEPGGTVWVHLDHAQHGLGSASCGPGVLPRHRLEPVPVSFSLAFSALPGETRA